MVYFQDQGVITYDPAYEAAMYPPTHLSPGESVFLPLYAPHRVTNDDGVCISWNVGFNTPRTRRRRDAHCVNLELRHLGLSPLPFGRHTRVDAMKSRLRLPFRAGPSARGGSAHLDGHHDGPRDPGGVRLERRHTPGAAAHPQRADAVDEGPGLRQGLSLRAR